MRRDGGYLVSPFVRTGSHRKRVDVQLPTVAPGRLWLERALDQLMVWRTRYDLDRHLHHLPFAAYKELFLFRPFQLSSIDCTRETP